MASDRIRILIVSDDARITVEATQQVVLAIDADVTVVDTIEQAGISAASGAFDAILAAEALPDGDGLALAQMLGESQTDATPLFILAGKVDAEVTLTAIRHGAVEVFGKPFQAEHMAHSIKRAVQSRRDRQFQENRSRRLRRLSSRLIRDRRELRQRVDLICRDVVHAYRRLAERTVRHSDPDGLAEAGGRMGSFDPNS